MNDRIRISPILLIDENNERIGEVPTHEALQRARELGMDLVEVAPEARPPVCRIMDYGKFKYEQSKKDKANKAKSKVSELKEVRLGRSMKIDPHDIAIRMKKAREFLLEGHKVQIVQNLRGREMQHKHRADDRMKDIIEQLSDIARLEVTPRFQGRRITMILAPDKPKIAQYLRGQGEATPKTDEVKPASEKSSADTSSSGDEETSTPEIETRIDDEARQQIEAGRS